MMMNREWCDTYYSAEVKVKVSLLSKHDAMKTFDVEGKRHAFQASGLGALYRVEGVPRMLCGPQTWGSRDDEMQYYCLYWESHPATSQSPVTWRRYNIWLTLKGSHALKFVMSICVMVKQYDVRFEVLRAVKISIVVFWIVTSCSLVGGHQRFLRNVCDHLQDYTACDGRNM
jgi:hypothetical protein